MTRSTTLEYAAPEPTRRPAWVKAVALVYVVFLGGFLTLPFLALASRSGDSWSLFGCSGIVVAVFLTGGGLLIAVPVRTKGLRPATRRGIWLPLIGSTILFAILCFAAGLAVYELLMGGGNKKSDLSGVVFFSLALLWIGWMGFFWFLSRSLDPVSLSARMYKALLAGSGLELLIAIPMHIVVRRRSECCAGYYTGTAIFLGALTAIFALGPGIVFLYYRRWKQVYRQKMDEKPRQGAL